MNVRELFTTLGFKVDQSGAKQYEEVFNRLKRLAVAAAAAIGATELVKSIIETTSAWQQENFQLSYIIGNTEKAHALMLRLNELASRSPFTREELAGYAKQLINFGFSVEEITPLMSRLSNIAAVLGSDKIPLITESLARMKQRGYADARVMMELFHAGIPIQEELAKRFNLTTFQMNKLIQEGRVGFRDVYQALTDLTTGTGKFAGANEAYSRTLAGQWKGVLHIIDDLKTTLGVALLPVVQSLLMAFRNWLDVNKGHLADDMIKLLNTVAYVLGFIVGRVRDLLNTLGLLPDTKTGKAAAKPADQSYFGPMKEDIGNFWKDLVSGKNIGKDLGKYALTGALDYSIPGLIFKLLSGKWIYDPNRMKEQAAAQAQGKGAVQPGSPGLVDNSVTVYMTLPPGSTKEQADIVERAARKVFEEENQKRIRQAAPSFAGANQ